VNGSIECWAIPESKHLAPDGWTRQAPAVGESGTIASWAGQVDPGASVVFTIVVRVDSTAPVGSAITCAASNVSKSIDANPADSTAQASAIVAPPLTASVDVAISGNIDPAAVGQAVTYTILVSNVRGGAATGAGVHVAVPKSATVVSAGGGT
jgi:uncharacterized repeat protein (TIGR01451 family)